jgi:hypothetical protein
MTLVACVLDIVPANFRSVLPPAILKMTSVKLSRGFLSVFSIWYASSEMPSCTHDSPVHVREGFVKFAKITAFRKS